MPGSKCTRRDAVRSVLAAVPLTGFDWDAWPDAQPSTRDADEFDVVVIGSGLGGLSCAASFSRKGYRALVLEQHDKPGGYATAFRRPGGFTFDVSLHSTTVGERDGVRNIISGFPEITSVEFAPHPHLYRTIFPDHDVRVPQRDVPGYTAMLARLFPQEKEGIAALIGAMESLNAEIRRFPPSGGKFDMKRFPVEFPTLHRCAQQTWGEMADARIRDPKLKAVVSALWCYYGLPPSRLSSLFYALPTIGYLQVGGYYPKGRSQNISDALVRFIEQRGGKVLLRTRVDRILVKDGAAYGVRCAGGQEFRGRAVVSNASAWHTFHKLLEDDRILAAYKTRITGFSTSLSCFQIFLGLKQDLAEKLGIRDSEIFIEPDYNLDASYEAARTADVEKCPFGITLYDNVFPGYSPKGKNTVNILALMGFDPWQKFEADYFAGAKSAYRAEKQRMANILIRRAEQALLPGLAKAIEVKDIGTPLTNLRYTGNYRGAIYGWDQTLDNSGAQRIGHSTPVRNLYLSGAWTRPGHGYGGVLASGPECFAEIVRGWT